MRPYKTTTHTFHTSMSPQRPKPLTKLQPLLYHHRPPLSSSPFSHTLNPASSPGHPSMANTSLQRFLLPQRRHSFANTAGIHESSSPSSILHKHTSSSSLSFRLYSNSSSPPSVTTTSTPTPVTPPATAENPPAPSLDLLARQLAAGDYRQADETTRALLIDLAGEPARRRGYVFFSEVRFIPAADLRAVDALWREHSGGRFGYSVQRRLWEKARRDFTRFFIRVGWMKKLDTEIEQYNYRAFPDEFVWELNDDTPEGHLPLTNALRGTQLLENILTHPAFSEEDEGQGQEEATTEEGGGGSGQSSRDGSSSSSGRERPKSMKDFKPDYSF